MRMKDGSIKTWPCRLVGGFGLARLGEFFGDTRAGAIGISSVLITLMCFGGTAFVSDHAVLLHQRDIMQAASASASVAATQQLAKLDAGLTDEELAVALEPLVTRYILANLPEGTRESARDTLEVTLTPDREAGVVGVEAAADLGGAIVGRHIWGRLVDKTAASSGAESIAAPVELVLAIDVTGSMDGSINAYAGLNFPEEDRRINVVRNAAQTLVDALYDQEGGDTGHVSVGLVPFNTTVNVGAARQDWVSDLGQGHKVIPAGFGPWRGCIEHREEQDDLDLSLVTPGEAPFTSWFWPSALEYRPTERAALDVTLAWMGGMPGENDWSASNPHEDYEHSPHFGCPRDEIIPLTTDRETVQQAIANMQPWLGGGTMTHLGAVWGRRLMASEWRDAWGLPEQDETELDGQKVLVLLSDGINMAYDDSRTYPGRFQAANVNYGAFTSHYTGYGRAGGNSGSGSIEEGFRVGTRLTDSTTAGEGKDILNSIFLESCELAKADGITVFTVSAVPRGNPQEQRLRERLIACATSEDHAFVDSNDSAGMQTAFQEIGRLVQAIRRTRTVLSGL